MMLKTTLTTGDALLVRRQTAERPDLRAAGGGASPADPEVEGGGTTVMSLVDNLSTVGRARPPNDLSEVGAYLWLKQCCELWDDFFSHSVKKRYV